MCCGWVFDHSRAPVFADRDSVSRGVWGEATDEPAREDARPTNNSKLLRVADPRSGSAPRGCVIQLGVGRGSGLP
jgi:hypothetical protein